MATPVVSPDQTGPPEVTTGEESSFPADYEGQLLGTSSHVLTKQLFNCFVEALKKALIKFKDRMLKEFPDSFKKDTATDVIVSIYVETMQRVLDGKYFHTMEDFIGAYVCCVPDFVVLPEDQIQLRTDLPSGKQLKKDINQLLQDFHKVKEKKAQLRYELNLAEEVFDHFTRQQSVLDQRGNSSVRGKGKATGIHHLLNELREDINILTSNLEEVTEVIDPDGDLG